jgi:U3 small nucleolar RNA-associated protein 6
MGRATRKFPNDMSLWMQYAELARKQKAFKQLSKVLTSMVRLHPTTPEAWIYAATYAMGELGDMAKARSYMQRGLRFCKESQILWLEFAKLEMSYLAKIYARRGILGLDSVPNPTEHTSLDDEDPDADIIALPTVTAGEIAQLSGAEPTDDNEVLKDPSGTPALSGAIPIAIFEAAMNHFKSEQLGEQFFDMVASFPSLPCTNTVLDYIVAHLNSMNPASAVALNASIRRSLVGVDISMPSFPQTLANALQALSRTLEEHPSLGLTVKSLGWMATYLAEDIDSDIRQVLSTTIERLLKRCVGAEPQSVQAKEVVPLLEKIRDSGHADTASELAQKALEAWPADPRLLQLVENDAAS